MLKDASTTYIDISLSSTTDYKWTNIFNSPAGTWWRSNCCILKTGNSWAPFTDETGLLRITNGITHSIDIDTGKFLRNSKISVPCSNIFLSWKVQFLSEKKEKRALRDYGIVGQRGRFVTSPTIIFHREPEQQPGISQIYMCRVCVDK